MLEVIKQALIDMGQILGKREVFAIMLGILAIIVLLWDERIHKQEMAKRIQTIPQAQATNHRQAG